jgi:GGDEF domain-containing protein
MPIGDLDLNVGVSIGVALSAGGAVDPATLVAQADRGMYADKRGAIQQR